MKISVGFVLALIIIFALVLSMSTQFISAYDPNPLQDFCVAINDTKIDLYVNGKFCKNPDDVKARDFFFSGLDIPADTGNKVGSNITGVNVDKIPGENTLGVSIARYDFRPHGQNPPHYHPRGSEIMHVQKGTLYVGYVSSNQDGNRLFWKILRKGDVFVVPIGLVHFQFNIGKNPAVSFSGFNSQDPGSVTIGNALFGSEPRIDPAFLAQGFQLDEEVIERLQSKEWVKNSF